MLRVGIVGSGFGLYGVLPAFETVKNCKVVSICGSKTPRLLKYCESIGLKNIYTSWEEMLKSEELDALAIAVVPSAQYKIAKAAMAKGLHIFAEKPLSLNTKQAKELLSIAAKNKLTTAVDFIFPEIEEWKKAKELVDKKTYGPLKHISVNWDFLSYDLAHGKTSWKTDVSQGGGALAFYFSHCLNYIENFAGQIFKTQSLLSYSPESKNGGEVGVDVLLKFKNGATGDAHVSCNAKGINAHKLTFFCQNATLVLENKNIYTDNFSLTVYQSGSVKNIKAVKKATRKNEDSRVKYVKKIAERFVKAAQARKQITPSFTEGLRVQGLIEKIRLSRIN